MPLDCSVGLFVKVMANGTVLDLLSTMRKDNTGSQIVGT